MSITAEQLARALWDDDETHTGPDRYGRPWAPRAWDAAHESDQEEYLARARRVLEACQVPAVKTSVPVHMAQHGVPMVSSPKTGRAPTVVEVEMAPTWPAKKDLIKWATPEQVRMVEAAMSNRAVD